MPRARALFLLVLSLLLNGCVGFHRTGWAQDTLYFGMSKPGGSVSPADWQGFVDSEISPRFPDGLTQLAADGQWRTGDKIEKEGSRVLILVHQDNASAEAKIAEIVASYKNRFQQESVLRVKQRVQASF
jgi:hypothetical protein